MKSKHLSYKIKQMSYKIGSVYRIVCLSHPNIQYVGSTFDTLRNRWQNHKSKCNAWIKDKNKTKSGCSLFPYIEKYGIEDFKILLIKKYNVCSEHGKDKKHLSVYELLHINKLKSVNEKNPFSIIKLTGKKYEFDNKEKLESYRKLHREKNREKLRETSCIWDINNADRKSENAKRSYERRKKKI